MLHDGLDVDRIIHPPLSVHRAKYGVVGGGLGFGVMNRVQSELILLQCVDDDLVGLFLNLVKRFIWTDVVVVGSVEHRTHSVLNGSCL